MTLTSEDRRKFEEEMPIVREFIDFVNSQRGVYIDGLAGFSGNRVRIERQKARILRHSGVKLKNREPVMVHTSHEQPNSPDVIHSHLTGADDYIAANSERGSNERQLCWSIIVFIYAFWEEQVRAKLAKIRGVHSDDVKVNVFGDLRLIRHAILHNKGVLVGTDLAKLKVAGALFHADQLVSPTHTQMHKLFEMIIQGISAIALTYIGNLPGAPDPSKLKSIAIQRGGFPPRK